MSQTRHKSPQNQTTPVIPEALCAQAPSHSREQLARNWVKVQQPLTAFIMASTPQYHDAQDLLQEVAAEIAIRFDEYDPARPFLPWAIWIAKLKIADYYRHQQRDRVSFLGDSIDALAEACTRVQEILDEEQRALDECLAGLTSRSQELLRMRYTLNKKPQEIGPELGMSPATVRVYLTRIRSTLTDCVRSSLSRRRG